MSSAPHESHLGQSHIERDRRRDPAVGLQSEFLETLLRQSPVIAFQ